MSKSRTVVAVGLLAILVVLMIHRGGARAGVTAPLEKSGITPVPTRIAVVVPTIAPTPVLTTKPAIIATGSSYTVYDYTKNAIAATDESAWAAAELRSLGWAQGAVTSGNTDLLRGLSGESNASNVYDGYLQAAGAAGGVDVHGAITVQAIGVMELDARQKTAITSTGGAPADVALILTVSGPLTATPRDGGASFSLIPSGTVSWLLPGAMAHRDGVGDVWVATDRVDCTVVSPTTDAICNG